MARETRTGPQARKPDPTLSDVRGVLDELYHEIDNHGRDTHMGQLCVDAYDTLRWLLNAYLRSPYDTPEDGS